jgi:hypothetical protein
MEKAAAKMQPVALTAGEQPNEYPPGYRNSTPSARKLYGQSLRSAFRIGFSVLHITKWRILAVALASRPM